ncbi:MULTISPECIES: deoxyribonuclease I [unclassified Enterococcus]|uniref:endonuclease III domain-containing protein n=1 Tax=unclassified Enterococcus TaxID=2608891 RepID=UPI0015546648|nr:MULTISPECIES: deoxyribonuclease I [unclassified Enterococcus]MBS7577110.1 deoxyribonuclease I [Enterococcus sp. MMGLQ5-2]MBS7584443.1 deoxyribonuclease I [Enterococcus sp. MMGLQ5-1]NPD12298.1 deoxyribonuclease I [Enterococcus sp. MMGLQ5-1]NPD36944.1 deoxyribonuclease I [Enterococcus sp. MMGLQ5-2]
MNRVNTRRLFQVLLREMGPQGWWPAKTKPEIVLGAILVQNTNWRNAEKALKNLNERTKFSPKKIKALQIEELELLIRPSGFYRNKAQTIQALFQWFELHDWNYEKISNTYEENLRQILLQIKGVGFETADVLLVYIFDRSEFIADAYARRLFSWLQQEEYQSYKELYEVIDLANLFTSSEAKEFHGLIDEFGKIYLSSSKKVKPNFLDREDLLS